MTGRGLFAASTHDRLMALGWQTSPKGALIAWKNTSSAQKSRNFCFLVVVVLFQAKSERSRRLRAARRGQEGGRVCRESGAFRGLALPVAEVAEDSAR